MNANYTSRYAHLLLAGASILAGAQPATSQVTLCDLDFTLTYGCNDDGTGWAMITDYKNPAGGEFHWDGSEAMGGQQITGLSNGQHSISVFDGVACEVTEYFTIDCSSEPVDCRFRTQTQGGWGAPAHGNDPGAYRNAHFASAFPNGLTIGCTRTLRLTTAAAVEAFLPSGSRARMLDAGHATDPGQSYRNVLAGQLVALTLSVGFDAADPDFGASSMPLAGATLLSGPFQGWSVQMLLNEANRFIGGCGSSYSAAQLNDALSMVNENYVGGDTDEGNLGCGGSKRIQQHRQQNELQVYPNPATDHLVVELPSIDASAFNISFIDATGRIAKQLMLAGGESGTVRSNAIDLQGLGKGTYLLRVEHGGTVQMRRVLIAH